MELAVFCALGLLIFALLGVWFSTRLRYRITPRHFEVRLFRLRLRKIPLEQILSVSKRRPAGWSEYWYNTLRPSHRRLVIRRSKGLRRYLVISPRNRYTFKGDLEKAIKRRLEPGTEEGSRFLVITD